MTPAKKTIAGVFYWTLMFISNASAVSITFWTISGVWDFSRAFSISAGIPTASKNPLNPLGLWIFIHLQGKLLLFEKVCSVLGGMSSDSPALTIFTSPFTKNSISPSIIKNDSLKFLWKCGGGPWICAGVSASIKSKSPDVPWVVILWPNTHLVVWFFILWDFCLTNLKYNFEKTKFYEIFVLWKRNILNPVG